MPEPWVLAAKLGSRPEENERVPGCLRGGRDAVRQLLDHSQSRLSCQCHWPPWSDWIMRPAGQGCSTNQAANHDSYLVRLSINRLGIALLYYSLLLRDVFVHSFPRKPDPP